MVLSPAHCPFCTSISQKLKKKREKERKCENNLEQTKDQDYDNITLIVMETLN